MKRGIYIYIGKRDRKRLSTFTLHSQFKRRNRKRENTTTNGQKAPLLSADLRIGPTLQFFDFPDSALVTNRAGHATRHIERRRENPGCGDDASAAG